MKNMVIIIYVKQTISHKKKQWSKRNKALIMSEYSITFTSSEKKNMYVCTEKAVKKSPRMMLIIDFIFVFSLEVVLFKKRKPLIVIALISLYA